MRLHRAMIYVSDLPRMRDFYTRMLGVGPLKSEWPDEWAEFNAGGSHFALHAIPAASRCDTPNGSSVKPREMCPVKLFFAVDDVNAERTRLESLGVPIIERPWGSWDGVDPEGNIFTVCSSTAS
jgi:catechol 2,3-dioxygenase-like lactoylglutathione lyase family enzyme